MKEIRFDSTTDDLGSVIFATEALRTSTALRQKALKAFLPYADLYDIGWVIVMEHDDSRVQCLDSSMSYGLQHSGRSTNLVAYYEGNRVPNFFIDAGTLKGQCVALELNGDSSRIVIGSLEDVGMTLIGIDIPLTHFKEHIHIA